MFVKHLLLFLIEITLKFVCKPLSLITRNSYVHKSKYIYIKYSGFADIDFALIVYIKKLNELGYKTYESCQGQEYLIYKNRFSLNKDIEVDSSIKELPYIIADDFPKELITLFKDKGEMVEEIDNKKAIYGRKITSSEYIFVLKKWLRSLD